MIVLEDKDNEELEEDDDDDDAVDVDLDLDVDVEFLTTPPNSDEKEGRAVAAVEVIFAFAPKFEESIFYLVKYIGIMSDRNQR